MLTVCIPLGAGLSGTHLASKGISAGQVNHKFLFPLLLSTPFNLSNTCASLIVSSVLTYVCLFVVLMFSPIDGHGCMWVCLAVM
jgi:hypothetical protein